MTSVGWASGRDRPVTQRDSSWSRGSRSRSPDSAWWRAASPSVSVTAGASSKTWPGLKSSKNGPPTGTRVGVIRRMLTRAFPRARPPLVGDGRVGLEHVDGGGEVTGGVAVAQLGGQGGEALGGKAVADVMAVVGPARFVDHDQGRPRPLLRGGQVAPARSDGDGLSHGGRGTHWPTPLTLWHSVPLLD